LTELEELEIFMSEPVGDISPIGSLGNLRRLRLFNSGTEESIEPLSSLINLRYLDLTYYDRYFKQLLPLHQLEVLRINNPSLEPIDVIYIAQLHSLRNLEIGSRLFLPSLQQLRNLVNLERLSISSSLDIDLSWITSLENLKRLEIIGSTIYDISPLAKLPNLEELDLYRTEVRDFTPLLESRSLTEISRATVEDEYQLELHALFRSRGITLVLYISDR